MSEKGTVMERLTTFDDTIWFVATSLGDFVDDFDCEAIAREVFVYENGRFVPVPRCDKESEEYTEEAYWDIVMKHDISQRRASIS